MQLNDIKKIMPRMVLKTTKHKDKETGVVTTTVKEVLADPATHPRPRIGKTAREWAANPNKEEHRISRLRSRSAAHIEAKTGRKVK